MSRFFESFIRKQKLFAPERQDDSKATKEWEDRYRFFSQIPEHKRNTDDVKGFSTLKQKWHLGHSHLGKTKPKTPRDVENKEKAEKLKGHNYAETLKRCCDLVQTQTPKERVIPKYHYFSHPTSELQKLSKQDGLKDYYAQPRLPDPDLNTLAFPGILHVNKHVWGNTFQLEEINNVAKSRLKKVMENAEGIGKLMGGGDGDGDGNTGITGITNATDIKPKTLGDLFRPWDNLTVGDGTARKAPPAIKINLPEFIQTQQRFKPSSGGFQPLAQLGMGGSILTEGGTAEGFEVGNAAGNGTAKMRGIAAPGMLRPGFVPFCKPGVSKKMGLKQTKRLLREKEGRGMRELEEGAIGSGLGGNSVSSESRSGKFGDGGSSSGNANYANGGSTTGGAVGTGLQAVGESVGVEKGGAAKPAVGVAEKADDKNNVSTNVGAENDSIDSAAVVTPTTQPTSASTPQAPSKPQAPKEASQTTGISPRKLNLASPGKTPTSPKNLKPQSPRKQPSPSKASPSKATPTTPRLRTPRSPKKKTEIPYEKTRACQMSKAREEQKTRVGGNVGPVKIVGERKEFLRESLGTSQHLGKYLGLKPVLKSAADGEIGTPGKPLTPRESAKSAAGNGKADDGKSGSEGKGNAGAKGSGGVKKT